MHLVRDSTPGHPDIDVMLRGGTFVAYSNPLVMSAVVSQHIKTAEDEYPSLRKGLKALQEEIDELTAEVSEGWRGHLRQREGESEPSPKTGFGGNVERTAGL